MLNHRVLSFPHSFESFPRRFHCFFSLVFVVSFSTPVRFWRSQLNFSPNTPRGYLCLSLASVILYSYFIPFFVSSFFFFSLPSQRSIRSVYSSVQLQQHFQNTNYLLFEFRILPAITTHSQFWISRVCFVVYHQEHKRRFDNVRSKSIYLFYFFHLYFNSLAFFIFISNFSFYQLFKLMLRFFEALLTQFETGWR